MYTDEIICVLKLPVKKTLCMLIVKPKLLAAFHFTFNSDYHSRSGAKTKGLVYLVNHPSAKD